MIKKFTFVFSLTLISQILSLFSVSFIVKNNATDSFIEFVALLDSSYLLINTILSFGILQIASREIVSSENWQNIVSQTQNIRLNFSFVLFIAGIVFYFITQNGHFLIFLLAPLLALNVNYLFYAIGKPQYAATNSSIRVIILSLSLFIIGTFHYFSTNIYLMFFILGLVYVAYVSNTLAKTKPHFKMSLAFIKEYSKSVGVGITDLSIIFLEFGILFFATFFYKSTIVAEAYILIKIITLVKGFQRMVFQVFYDQLKDRNVAYFLDQFILFSGFSFFTFSFLFSDEILILLYDKNDNVLQNNFMLLSVALLIASIILASMARTLILKNDKTYIRSYVLALFISCSSMIYLSYSILHEYGISISLLLGEFILFLSFFIGIRKEIEFKKYLLSLLKYVMLFLLYFFISKIYKTLASFLIIAAIHIALLTVFLYHNKKFITK